MKLTVIALGAFLFYALLSIAGHSADNGHWFKLLAQLLLAPAQVLILILIYVTGYLGLLFDWSLDWMDVDRRAWPDLLRRCLVFSFEAAMVAYPLVFKGSSRWRFIGLHFAVGSIVVAIGFLLLYAAGGGFG